MAGSHEEQVLTHFNIQRSKEQERSTHSKYKTLNQQKQILYHNRFVSDWWNVFYETQVNNCIISIWAIRNNSLPFQDVTPRRLVSCSPQRSTDGKWGGVAENRWLNKAGELTDLWRPGSQGHWEGPEQPCQRGQRMKTHYGCYKLTCHINAHLTAHIYNGSCKNSVHRIVIDTEI